MSIDHGRSPSEPGYSAEPEPKEVSAVPVSIPNAANYAPIFRRGMGVAIEAVDCLRSRWRKSRKLSPTTKQFDEALDQLLDQLAQDSRIPWMIRDYHDANDASNSIEYGFRHLAGVLSGTASAIEARSDATGTGAAEGESAVGEAETPTPLSSTNPNTERQSL